MQKKMSLSNEETKKMAEEYKLKMMELYKKNKNIEAGEIYTSEKSIKAETATDNIPEIKTNNTLSEEKTEEKGKIISEDIPDIDNLFDDIETEKTEVLNEKLIKPLKLFSQDEECGLLEVDTTAANQAIPVEGTVVTILSNDKIPVLYKFLITNSSGKTKTISLPAPPKALSEQPSGSGAKPYSTYNVKAYADGYYPVEHVDVPVFATIKSIQKINMIPLAEYTKPYDVPFKFVEDRGSDF